MTRANKRTGRSLVKGVSATQTLAARDPVIDFSLQLGQAWNDHDRAQAANKGHRFKSEAEAEAWQRVEALEAMIGVTRAHTLAGAAVQLCMALTELKNNYTPEETEVGMGPREVRHYEDTLRMALNALSTLVTVERIDLTALGIEPYMFQDQSAQAKRLAGGRA